MPEHSFLEISIPCASWVMALPELRTLFLGPILLNSKGKSSSIMDSWITDKKKYSEKDKEKLEKGSGFVKAWTLVSNWIYRVISW
jgi:hypothetical protein